MLQAELSGLKEREAALRALDDSTSKLIADLGASAPLICSALKDGMKDVYTMLNETYKK